MMKDTKNNFHIINCTAHLMDKKCVELCSLNIWSIIRASIMTYKVSLHFAQLQLNCELGCADE